MNTNDDETRSLDELHSAAVAEGGKLVVYGGGDTATQMDSTAQGFASAFPDIDIDMIVDYSKYHNVRIDRQLTSQSLVPDVTHLQTLHDFPRWKQAGVLLKYKPSGFTEVHETLKDPDGYWTAFYIVAFSYMFGPEGGPQTPRELTDPEWEGRIFSAHPGDDDAVLFLYKLYVEAYGFEWLDGLARQRITFHRGTNTPGEAVVARQAAVGIGGQDPEAGDTKWALPDAGHPFMAWGQRVAILKNATHPAAAKLYVNWLLSPQVQGYGYRGWNVRRDLVPAAGAIWDLPNAHVDAFADFMMDREQVEWWRNTMVLHLGEVAGPPTPGWLGLAPSTHL